MCSHSWDKLIAASAALAAAGVLTCAAALLDATIRHGSLVTFLASMAFLGLAVTGAMIGFTWVCDQGESYSPARVSVLIAGKPVVRRRAVRANLLDSLRSIGRVRAKH